MLSLNLVRSVYELFKGSTRNSNESPLRDKLVSPQPDKAMLGKMDLPGPKILKTQAADKGGIDFNLEKYDIKFKQIPINSNGLSVFPQDLQGFRFNIVQMIPFTLHPSDFFGPSYKAA